MAENTQNSTVNVITSYNAWIPHTKWSDSDYS